MLVDKRETFQNGDVVVVKTLGGEEITGRFVAIDDDHVTLLKPVRLDPLPVPNHPGQCVVGFMPFMLGLADEAKVKLSLRNLLSHPVLARSDLANQYLKATTGLDLNPKNGGLVI